jgi:hypothetical protein
MRAEISEIKTSWQGFERLVSLNAEVEDLLFDNLELDLSKCSWFDANMSAPLGVILARCADDLNDVTVTGVREEIVKVLSKNLFLRNYGYPPVADENGTVVPFKRFDRTDGRYFAAYVNQYTQGKGIPEMSPLLRRKFNEAIGELFANAVTHSASRLGIFACGQYFPKTKCFDFCIADAGGGFVGAIKRAFDLEIDSLKAMKTCLRDGFTTKQHEPGGLGLKLIKNFIELNKGRLVIVSNSAYYEFSHSGAIFRQLGSAFPGTCINIEINTADRSSYHLSSEVT